MEVPKPVPTEVAEDAPRLPVGFVSADVAELFLELRTAGKSEFETAEVYKKRLGEEARTYSFQVEPMETTYDADHAQMVARLRVKVDASTTDIKEHSLMVPVVHKVEHSTFPASNAFGVKVDVQRTDETDYGVAVVKIPATVIGKHVPSALYERYERFFDVRVPMSPDDARQRKSSLRFVLRGEPSMQTAARTFEDVYEWKATIASPTSLISRSHAVYVDRLAVWLVDSTRGDIFKRTSIAELLRTTKAE